MRTVTKQPAKKPSNGQKAVSALRASKGSPRTYWGDIRSKGVTKSWFRRPRAIGGERGDTA